MERNKRKSRKMQERKSSTDELGNESQSLLHRSANSLSNFFDRLKFKKRSDGKFDGKSSMTLDVDRRLSNQPLDQRKIRHLDTVEFHSHYEDDVSLCRSTSSTFRGVHSKHEKESSSKNPREVELPSVAVNIQHSDAELHDFIARSGPKSSLKRSKIPRARKPGCHRFNRHGQPLSSRYSVRKNTSLTNQRTFEKSSTVAQPVTEPVKRPVTPPERKIEEKIVDQSDSESLSLGEDISEVKNPLTSEEQSDLESSSEEEASSSELEVQPTLHCPCHCTLQSVRKQQAVQNEYTSCTSEDSDSCDAEESSPDDSTSPESRKKIEDKSRVNAAKSRVKFASKHRDKSEKFNRKQKDRKRGFLCTIFDIFFWPVTYFRGE